MAWLAVIARAAILSGWGVLLAVFFGLLGNDQLRFIAFLGSRFGLLELPLP